MYVYMNVLYKHHVIFAHIYSVIEGLTWNIL